MANSNEITAKIIIRGGTTAEWESKNPILDMREVGAESCADGIVRMKIGNGTAAWNDIPDIVSVSLKKVTGSGNISVTVEDNTEYRYTDVTSLNITCPDGEFECFIRASFSSGISFSVTNGNPCHSNYDLAEDTGGGDADYSGTVLEIHIKDGWYTIIVDDLGTYTGK